MRSRPLRAVRDDWRLAAAAVLGLGVLAALITVLAVLITRPASPSGGEAVPQGPAEADLDRPLPEIGMEDFVVPNEGEQLETWWWRRYRTPGEAWDSEQVERFWRNPREPAQQYLRSRNDEEIMRVFRDVP
ncbi:MAG: hypothetical protein ACLFPO_12075 [Spirochaetaceae bacterium]